MSRGDTNQAHRAICLGAQMTYSLPVTSRMSSEELENIQRKARRERPAGKTGIQPNCSESCCIWSKHKRRIENGGFGDIRAGYMSRRKLSFPQICKQWIHEKMDISPQISQLESGRTENILLHIISMLVTYLTNLLQPSWTLLIRISANVLSYWIH